MPEQKLQYLLSAHRHDIACRSDMVHRWEGRRQLLLKLQQTLRAVLANAEIASIYCPMWTRQFIEYGDLAVVPAVPERTLEVAKRERSHRRQVSPAVASLLSGSPCPKVSLIELRKLAPGRQLTAARIMLSTGMFSRTFARVLVARAPIEDLLPPLWPRGLGLLSTTQVQIMMEEAAGLDDRFLAGLGLQPAITVATGCLRGLADDIVRTPTVLETLSASDPEVLRRLLEARHIHERHLLQEGSLLRDTAC